MKKYVKTKNINLILFISILFLSCDIFYPYEDDCGVIDGTNKLLEGQCYNTENGAADSYGSYDCWVPSCSGVWDDSDFNANEMCCECGGGYVTDGTEDCPFNPEIHN